MKEEEGGGKDLWALGKETSGRIFRKRFRC